MPPGADIPSVSAAPPVACNHAQQRESVTFQERAIHGIEHDRCQTHASAMTRLAQLDRTAFHADDEAEELHEDIKRT